MLTVMPPSIYISNAIIIHMDERLIISALVAALLVLSLCTTPKSESKEPEITEEELQEALDNCASVDFNDERDTCYNRLLVETVNTTLCELISNINLKKECRARTSENALG